VTIDHPLMAELDDLAASFDEDGYVIVKGLFDDTELFELEASLVRLQEDVRTGVLDRARYGGDYLTSAGDDIPDFVNYVKDATRLSEPASAAFHHPVLLALLERCLGVTPWEMREEYGARFGVVYQDARPGQESAYSRIGWHSDHQAYPTSDFYPGVALTFHLDATSPANGFLRVLPGSHKLPTDGMPLRFEKVPGEIGVYCDAGDVLLHHCDLWHSAARATEDAPDGIRRHLRGGWFGGREPEIGEELEAFNKNAAR
jgi:hypothetical protein